MAHAYDERVRTMRVETQYEVIVLGLGGMGSAAAYHLARRGRRVLGLDAFARGHHNGSSHGRSRGIREAYGESPAYVPLAQRAYALWRELEAETGQHLLTITGGMSIGPAEPGFGANQKAAAAQYGLTVEELGAEEIMARWPGFRVPAGYVGMYDPHAGFLLPEPCVAAHLDLAATHGAIVHHGEPVRRWSPDGAGIRVETETAAYTADARSSSRRGRGRGKSSPTCTCRSNRGGCTTSTSRRRAPNCSGRIASRSTASEGRKDHTMACRCCRATA